MTTINTWNVDCLYRFVLFLHPDLI